MDNKISKDLKGPKELQDEVLASGRCTACGLCLGLCPYLDELGENVAFISACKGEEGRCYAICPRTLTDLDALRERHFPGQAADPLLGPYQSIWMARAKGDAIRQAGQYGGTISALAVFGLEGGRLDSALLTQWASDSDMLYLPEPVLAKTAEQVLAAAGSKYTACPTLKRLDQALAEEAKKLLIVSRPCQVLALRKRMAIDDKTFPQKRIALIFGLFCMWSLSYRPFRKMMADHHQTARPLRIDIPKGRFVIETDQDRLELPHDALRQISREACQSCYDFTSELADLSVGSTEWKDDWNTLIVRSDRGKEYIEAAVEQGYIELAPFPEERFQLLREAAFDKKKRVLELLQQEEQQGRESYLKISEKEKEYFLG